MPESGKTKKMMREMATNKGKYIFATSRIDLINERIGDLRRNTAAAGTNPTIHPIHGETNDRCRGPVLAEIEDAARLHQDEEHVVVFVTHEGMMGANLDGFAGWHIFIDENPAAVASNAITVPATATYLEAAYDLVPLDGTKWSRLVLKPEAPSPSAIIKDDFLKGLATIDKRARSTQGVYVDIDDWAKVKGSARRLKWWSAWTPAELAAFESVTIAGAGYFHSLGYKATQAWFSDKVSFEAEEVIAPGRARPRVRISYFTRHRGSTAYWGKAEGLDCLLAVIDHLKGIRDLGYWATNNVFAPYFVGARLSGEMVSPRQEGTNALMHHTSCALIYSAKAVPADGPSLEVFGLTQEDVERAREIEDIIQFVLRGALRKADFNGEYRVYLYDLHQAEVLAAYLEQEGIATVELVPVDEAGIMDVEREKRGRKRVELDERSKAEQAQRRREADRTRKANGRAAEREEKRNAGTLQGRGRPKGTGTPMRSRRFRNELKSVAKKNRYGWKEDLCAIREREAAEAREQERKKPKKP
jgi:hypothetical protein